MASKVTTVNPATGRILADYDVMGRSQVETLVKRSKDAFADWKRDFDKRAHALHLVSQKLRENKEGLAKIATAEMGKPIREAVSEVEKCAWAIEYYADNGKSFLHEEALNTDARKSVIAFEPLGVIGSIMPWNFPFWQALRFAAPSLMAGNTIVLKPASATMRCGIEIEEFLEGAGLPENVFQTAIGDSSVAEHLLDSDVSGITFTGSTNVGIKVGQKAASGLKKCVLELGGSDPFIVCSDADPIKAAEGAVKGRFINCGQSCVASKRFFVAKNVADEFIEHFIKKTESLRVGDPMSADTDIGPLVNRSGMETIEEQVEDAKSKGAEILTGGQKVGGDGYYYKPTILKNISKGMRVYFEETFGPVASIMVVDDEMDSIRLANDTEFGLGASVWTGDLAKAERFTRSLESGMVSVNNVLVSDPRIPFGGVKKSGFGRELSRYGMLEFVNMKSIRYYDNLTRNHFVE